MSRMIKNTDHIGLVQAHGEMAIAPRLHRGVGGSIPSVPTLEGTEQGAQLVLKTRAW